MNECYVQLCYEWIKLIQMYFYVHISFQLHRFSQFVVSTGMQVPPPAPIKEGLLYPLVYNHHSLKTVVIKNWNQDSNGTWLHLVSLWELKMCWSSCLEPFFLRWRPGDGLGGPWSWFRSWLGQVTSQPKFGSSKIWTWSGWSQPLRRWGQASPRSASTRWAHWIQLSWANSINPPYGPLCCLCGGGHVTSTREL